MRALSLSEAQSAPFASSWRVVVSFVHLDVLDWVTKAILLDTCASDLASVHFNDRQSIDQFLGIGTVRDH